MGGFDTEDVVDGKLLKVLVAVSGFHKVCEIKRGTLKSERRRKNSPVFCWSLSCEKNASMQLLNVKFSQY